MTIGVLFGKMKFFAERPHKLKSGAKNSYLYCNIKWYYNGIIRDT